MVINFDKRNNGGGGGTSDYSQLTNKPQINGVELVGNKTSQQLGITSESLEAVSTVPSGASVGDVYAVNKSQTVGYGWEQIENGYAFNCSLNPISGEGATYVYLGGFLGPTYDTAIYMHSDNSVEVLSEYTNIGFTRRIEAYGSYINVNYYDYHRIEFTFEGGVPTLQDAIASASTTIDENKTVQVETVNAPLAHWEFWNQYQGRYQEIQFWLEQNGQKDFLPSTELGLFHYYELYYKLYTNAEGLFCVDYSNDSGTTWSQYIHNANIPLDEPDYYPIDITDPNGKNALFKAWFRAGNGNYGVTIKCNKFLWIDDYVTPTGALTKNLIKEGEVDYDTVNNKPKINGVELDGNKSTDDLGLTPDKLLRKDNLVLQKEINATKCLNWANVNGIVVSIDWDGHSDMLLSFNWEDDWGNSGQTMYFSGGTWYNVPEDTSTFVLENGKLYFGYGGYGHLTSIAQGSLSSAVTFYKDVQINIDGQYIDQIGNVISSDLQIANGNDWYTFVSGVSRNVKLDNVSDGNLTINYGDNIEETVEISGGQIVAGPDWIWESDHYYKYTPDMGKLMIFNFGSLYWEIRGGSGNLFINNPDVNGLASSISAKEAYEPMVGPYMYNGKVWKKVAKKNETPAGGKTTHWFNYSDGNFTLVREDCTNDGDYLCHFGPEIEGSRSFKGLQCANGEIDTTYTGWGMNHVGNGHMVGSTVDANGVTYWAHAWSEGGKLYWELNTPVMDLDAYGTGSNKEGGLVY